MHPFTFEMNLMKKTLTVLAIFLILIVTVSVVSAGCNYGSHTKYNNHHYKHYQGKNCNTHQKYCHPCSQRNCDNGSCNNGNSDNGSVEEPEVTPVEPTGDTGTTSYNPKTGNTYWVGADGQKLLLINNNDAVNPSYDQLLVFLKADKTDEHPYTSTYTCGDFGETLHNNAEAAGLRCALVGSNSCNHAFNEFETTDKGIVYIDCTGVPGGAQYQDKELTLGSSLVGKYLFKSGSMTMSCNPGSLLVFW